MAVNIVVKWSDVHRLRSAGALLGGVVILCLYLYDALGGWITAALVLYALTLLGLLFERENQFKIDSTFYVDRMKSLDKRLSDAENTIQSHKQQLANTQKALKTSQGDAATFQEEMLRQVSIADKAKREVAQLTRTLQEQNEELARLQVLEAIERERETWTKGPQGEHLTDEAFSASLARLMR